ncbi:MAG: hypothetical protein KBT54_07190, partial [Amphritea sp.]|nr:hypothetical protein [Amphritea sp.]
MSKTQRTWLLLAGESEGLAVPFSLRLLRGVHGHDLKTRLSPAFPPESDISVSSQQASELAYQLLWAEGYERRSQHVIYQLPQDGPIVNQESNIEGRSTDLAFALGLLSKGLGGNTFPVLAATGKLGKQGEVLAVSRIADKITAALNALPSQSVIVFPEVIQAEIPTSISIEAAEKNIRLLPVNRLDEAASLLGMRVQNTHLASPFRGLEPFDIDHSGLFFGRDEQVSEITDQLKKQQAVLVLGASGSGKSSVVQAGVLAELYKRSPERHNTDYRWAIYRPRNRVNEHNWESSIRQAWGNANIPPELLPTISAEDLKHAVQQLSPQENQQLIFIVDQLEELFTQGLEQPEIDEFILYLVSLIDAGIWLVATLRNDFYPAYQESGLAEIFGPQRTYNLLQPDNIALEQIIERPAQLAGISYEERNRTLLSARIREDAAKETGVLPLLEYTLSELYNDRDKQKNQLTYTAYENFGGVQGSIGRTAEQVYLALNKHLQNAVAHLIRNLTRWDDAHQRFVSRSYPINAAQSEVEHRIIECFSHPDVRLLMMDKDGDTPVLRVAHEALITHWPRAINWLNNDIEFLRWYAQIETEAQQWLREDRLKERLLSKGKPLADAENYLSHRTDNLSKEVTTYIQASSRQVKKKNRFALSMATTIFMLLFGLTGWALQQRESAEQNQILAVERATQAETEKKNAQVSQSQHLLNQSRSAYEKGYYDKATLLALNALPGNYGGDRPYPRGGLNALNKALLANNKIFNFPHLGSLYRDNFAISPDGKWIVTTTMEKQATVWSLHTGQALFTIPQENPIDEIAFHPDSNRLLITTYTITESLEGDDFVERGHSTIEVWSINSKGKLTSFLPYADRISKAVFSPDQQHVLTAYDDSVAVLWNIDTREPVKVFHTKDSISNAHFSHNGKHLALQSHYNVELWTVETETKPQTFKHHLPVNHVQFVGEEQQLLTISSQMGEGRADFWAFNGEHLNTIEVPYGKVTKASVHPRHSALLLYATNDGSIYSLDLELGKEYAQYTHDRLNTSSYYPNINNVSFNANGNQFISAADDGTTILWNNSEGALEMNSKLNTFATDTAALSADFLPNDSQIYTVTENGITIWSIDGSTRILDTADNLQDMAFIPGTDTLVTVSEHQVALWSSESGINLNKFPLKEISNSPILTLNNNSILYSDETHLIQRSLKDGHLLHRFPESYGVYKALISGDEKYILSLSEDGIGRLWSTETGLKLDDFHDT